MPNADVRFYDQKSTKFDFCWGSDPDPTSKGREGEEGGRKGRGKPPPPNILA